MRGARPFAELEQRVQDALVPVQAGDIAVACSGGPDSVALLGAAAAVARAAGGRRVVALHVNHGVRALADRDEGVAMAAAAALGVPFHSIALDPGGAEDEATLRDLRYRELAAMAQAAGCVAVATAHALDDQVETVLLALIRGTGLRGLAGMPARRPLVPGIELLRPVLERRREELRGYCCARALPYAVDETNEQARYRRGRLRALLATLREAEPSAEEAIARMARIAREEDAWLDERATEALARSEVGRDRLRGTVGRLPRPLLRRVLRQWLGGRDLAFEHVEQLAEALAAGRSGRYFVRKGEEVMIHGGVVERRAAADGFDERSEEAERT